MSRWRDFFAYMTGRTPAAPKAPQNGARRAEQDDPPPCSCLEAHVFDEDHGERVSVILDPFCPAFVLHRSAAVKEKPPRERS